ncbi:TPA: DUF488 family protein [Streptococcus suis]
MKKLYTIGHSTYNFSYLVERLQKYKIDWVFDVRSTPFSAFAPQYNSYNLSKELPKFGISYFEMGEYFGARQLDSKYRYCYPEGYLDFGLWCQTVPYQKAKKGLLNRGITNHNIALMCTEKDPIDCHRTIMITRDLELDGIESYHILGNGELKTQKELTKDVLNSYLSRKKSSLKKEDHIKGQGTFDLFGSSDEVIFFEDVAEISEEHFIEQDQLQQIVEAYREINEKIGYRIVNSVRRWID